MKNIVLIILVQIVLHSTSIAYAIEKECHLIDSNSQFKICGNTNLNSDDTLTVQTPTIQNILIRPKLDLKRTICKAFGRENVISSKNMWTKEITRVN